MKKIRTVTTFILAFLLVLTIFPASTALAATDVSAQTNVTTSQMTIKTAGGVVIPPGPSGNYTNIPKDSRVFVEYAFDLLDDNGLDILDPAYEEYFYSAGDYIVVQLPYAVLFEAPPGGWNVVAEGTSDVMGVLSIDSNGVATIVFTDYVETHSSVRGWFSLDGNFKDGTFTAGDPVEIDVEFSGTVINIGFIEDPTELEISCDKEVVYDSSANEITWTITVTPNMEAMDVTITDSFSSNQVYVPNSFTAGGAPVADSELTFNSPTSFDYSVGLLSSETVFTYKTTPTETAFKEEDGTHENVSFTNSVDVYSEGDKFADDSATVSMNWIQKTGAIEGTASDEEIRTINWTVNVNNQNYSLSDAYIKDVIPAGIELVIDATHKVEVEGVEFTYAASGSPGTYDIVNGNELIVNIGDITTQQTLTFSTRVTDDSLFEKNGATEFTNSAYFYWLGIMSNFPSDSYGVDVGRGVLTKTAGLRVNYLHSRDNVITWKLQINANKVDITDASFTDIIPAGLEYVADSFTINDPHDMVPGDFKGTFSYESSTRELKYDFGSGRTISEEYTATFDTTITDYTVLYVNQNNISIGNSATLYGTGILSGEVSDSGSQRFNSQVVSKSVASGYDHTTKRVKWSITVNRNEIPMYGAELADDIPVGMSLIPETFTVTPAIVGEPENAFEYTVHPFDDIVSQDSFKYTFPDTFSDRVTITYETQVKEAYMLTQGTKSFTNTSVLTATDLSASSTAVASFDNYMVKKDLDYTTGADYIEWAIVINAQAISLTDIEASDVLQDGLLVDLDSVVLYPMTVAANGTLTRQDTPVSTDLYTVTYNETTRELKLNMPGTHTEPYQLEFITDVLEDSMTVSNTVTLAGHSYTATSELEGAVIEVDESGLGGTGVQGSITIEKVNKSDEPLSGAVFTLYNNRGEQVAQDKTDEFGRVVFGGLPIRTYVLEETTPPPGYIKSDQTVRFRMDTSAPNEFFKFEDEKMGSITIEKVNAWDEPLSGAVFTLYDSEGEVVAEKTTDDTGRVTFTDLPNGTYVLKETTPPTGYVKSEEEKTFIISVDDKDLFYEFENETFGSITIEKVNASDEPLSGALFALYDSEGELVAEKTTDDTGRVAFTDLLNGTYVLKETAPPAGYIRKEEAVIFNVTTDDKNLFYEFENEHENPETGAGDYSWGLLIGIAGLMLAGAVIILVRSTKTQQNI